MVFKAVLKSRYATLKEISFGGYRNSTTMTFAVKGLKLLLAVLVFITRACYLRQAKRPKL